MMKPNYELKAAIITHHGTQVRFSQKVNIPELRISQIIHGRAIPTEDEKRIIAQELGIEVYEAFPC